MAHLVARLPLLLGNVHADCGDRATHCRRCFDCLPRCLLLSLFRSLPSPLLFPLPLLPFLLLELRFFCCAMNPRRRPIVLHPRPRAALFEFDDHCICCCWLRRIFCTAAIAAASRCYFRVISSFDHCLHGRFRFRVALHPYIIIRQCAPPLHWRLGAVIRR